MNCWGVEKFGVLVWCNVLVIIGRLCVILFIVMNGVVFSGVLIVGRVGDIGLDSNNLFGVMLLVGVILVGVVFFGWGSMKLVELKFFRLCIIFVGRLW